MVIKSSLVAVNLHVGVEIADKVRQPLVENERKNNFQRRAVLFYEIVEVINIISFRYQEFALTGDVKKLGVKFFDTEFPKFSPIFFLSGIFTRNFSRELLR